MSHPPKRKASWVEYLQYMEGRDSPVEVRNVLLVVAALIAAATFQIGVNPPGGVWQDSSSGHEAGRAIFGSDSVAYSLFLISNTLAFSSSLLMLQSLTHNFPFRLEVFTAIFSMAFTYGSAVTAVTPQGSLKFNYFLFAVVAPPVLRYCVDTYRKLKQAETQNDDVGAG